MNIDILHLSLAGFVVGFIFQPQITAVYRKAKARLFRDRVKMDVQIYRKLSDVYVDQHRLWDRGTAELNHIKGQLQEVLQTQKQHGEVIGHNLNTVALVSTQALNEVKALKGVVESHKPPVTEPAQVYLEALGKLAQGLNKTLERQEKNEELLLELGNEIKKLTRGV